MGDTGGPPAPAGGLPLASGADSNDAMQRNDDGDGGARDGHGGSDGSDGSDGDNNNGGGAGGGGSGSGSGSGVRARALLSRDDVVDSVVARIRSTPTPTRDYDAASDDYGGGGDDAGEQPYDAAGGQRHGQHGSQGRPQPLPSLGRIDVLARQARARAEHMAAAADATAAASPTAGIMGTPGRGASPRSAPGSVPGSPVGGSGGGSGGAGAGGAAAWQQRSTGLSASRGTGSTRGWAVDGASSPASSGSLPSHRGPYTPTHTAVGVGAGMGLRSSPAHSRSRSPFMVGGGWAVLWCCGAVVVLLWCCCGAVVVVVVVVVMWCCGGAVVVARLLLLLAGVERGTHRFCDPAMCAPPVPLPPPALPPPPPHHPYHHHHHQSGSPSYLSLGIDQNDDAVQQQAKVRVESRVSGIALARACAWVDGRVRR